MAQWPGILFLRTMAATWRTASGWGVGVGVEGLGLGLGLELELELMGGGERWDGAAVGWGGGIMEQSQEGNYRRN